MSRSRAPRSPCLQASRSRVTSPGGRGPLRVDRLSSPSGFRAEARSVLKPAKGRSRRRSSRKSKCHVFIPFAPSIGGRGNRPQSKGDGVGRKGHDNNAFSASSLRFYGSGFPTLKPASVAPPERHSARRRRPRGRRADDESLGVSGKPARRAALLALIAGAALFSNACCKLVPWALAVDPTLTGNSNGDGMLEPGETVAIVPSWSKSYPPPTDPHQLRIRPARPAGPRPGRPPH